jgi:TrmH family RNA methyltransferase
LDHTPLLLSSLANPRVKDVVRLRQRSHRDELNLMLIEGYRELKRALDNGYRPSQLFTCPEFFMGTHEGALIARAREARAEHVHCTRDVFAKMSARDRPDGLLAVGPQIRLRLADLRLPPNALVVVAEAIEKPGNLGTILRSSDAAGVHAVVVCDRCTDINNPNVVRASIGTLFSLPVVEATTEETLAFLREHGFKVLAATPHADQLYTAPDLTGPTAVVVGSEQYGLTETWLNAADARVRIPMLGQCDSLNVAAATTILLFEAARQRIALRPDAVPAPHTHEAHDSDSGD